jgi:hypothetical protein
MSSDDPTEGPDGVPSLKERLARDEPVATELSRIRDRLTTIMGRLEPIEHQVQALESRRLLEASNEPVDAGRGERDVLPGEQPHVSSEQPHDVDAIASSGPAPVELDTLPEPPPPRALSAPVSHDLSIPKRRLPRLPESVSTRPIVQVSVSGRDPLTRSDAGDPVSLPVAAVARTRARRRARLACAIAALTVLAWGGVKVGSDAVVERLEARLTRAGLSGDVTLTLGARPRVTIDGLKTREPLIKRGVAVHIEADGLALSIDLFEGLRDGAWLAEPVQLRGVRVALSKTAAREAPGAAPRGAEGTMFGPAFMQTLSKVCTHDCVVAIADAAVTWDGAGLRWEGWSGVDGELRVTDRGSGTLTLQDSKERSMTLSVGLTDWATDHALTLTGRHEGQLDLHGLGLDERLPWPEGLEPLHGSVMGVSVVDGVWALSGLEGRTRDASGRTFSAHVERVSVPLKGSLTATLEGLVVEGMSARAELPEHGGHLASAQRITFDGPGLFPCMTERWCPTRVDGARLTVPSYAGLWSALAMEAGAVESCGAECVAVSESALEVRRGAERLDTAWRHVRASWQAGAKGPAQVHVDGGHVDALLAFEGLAKDHQGTLVPVAAEAFDAASALAAFSLRPKRKRSGVRAAKEEETGRLIRTLVQAVDGVVEGGLKRWPTLQSRWSEWTGSDHAELSLTDAAYEVTLGELPALSGRVERLEGRVMATAVALSVDARLGVPEGMHLPEEVRTMSMPASHRGLWGGPGYFEGRVELSYRDEGGLRLSFDGRTPWLYLAHERIALERIDVAPLEMRGALLRRQDEATLQWELDDVDIFAARGGHLHLSAGITLEQARKRGRLQLAAELPMQDCGALHESVPAAMLYGLQGARFRGEAGLSVVIDYPLHAVAGLKVSLGADFEGCVADTLGEDISVAALNRSSSVFHVYDHRLNQAIRVGPGTGNWVSLSSMPAHVWGAAMATEDFNFFTHKGFSRTFIGRALRLNLRTRRYAYGGSTITQQLVKNLFLTRHKTLARKLVEAVLVWQVERHVSKRRILALYVNCIEYGPRIYGIRNAARRYFGTVPSRLSPVESAFIMNIKPFPWTGYWIFKKRMLTSFFAKRAQVIKQRLLGRGYISAEQAEGMVATNLYTRFMETF